MASAILRGSFALKGGKYVWSGSWALNKEDFSNDKASKFRLISQADDEASMPPDSAIFSGYFEVKEEAGGDESEDKEASGDASVSRVKEKKVKISFIKAEDGKYRVEGKGKNRYGRFELQGMMKGKGLSCTKTYAAGEDEDFEDDLPFDREEVDEELADLREDAKEHDLLLEGETKKRKRRAAAEEAEKVSKKKKAPENDEEEESDGDYDGNAEEDSEDDSGEEESEEESDDDIIDDSVPTETPEDKSQVEWKLSELEGMQKRLAKAVKSGESSSILKALSSLKAGGKITVELLKQCTVAKDVRNLKKTSGDGKVSSAATELVDFWKKSLQ